ncbi:hypothetical protein BLS_003355 [Venturia inaequalis]|uniref:Elongation of fatty acids protein n=1 Tax=Venturia inaequalis TaxID=5025 RepID=A0A8H3Z312_VENIN|nr:hypothetical protein BLS_003355 [Venturia inaequalis]KAE9984720.1 hypothetical protein EG328_008337 [Venturia inaequalis]KAE9992898.1 hypothetical protein EG327_007375 [Venturia inaequalis]
MATIKHSDWLEVGWPTVERPFGLALWPIFDKAYVAINGYHAEDFKFVQAKTNLSTYSTTFSVLVAYYLIIFGGREYMRSREPIKLSFFFKLHNFYLTLISGGLLALFAEQMIPSLYKNGLFYCICHIDGGWADKLVILYYLNYLTKFLELLDTCFLFLKKKPLTFLHTYHHGATALLCYTQLIGHTAVSWVPITLNLSVHVVMYWYYFQSARGIRIWWKQYITVMQITQFVVDLGFVYFASWTYFTSTYFPSLPNLGRCAGEEFAAIAGICILSSYLLLFISFYAATYKKPLPKGRARAKSALKDMASEGVPPAPDTAKKSNGGVAHGFQAANEKGGATTRSRKA